MRCPGRLPLRPSKRFFFAYRPVGGIIRVSETLVSEGTRALLAHSGNSTSGTCGDADSSATATESPSAEGDDPASRRAIPASDCDVILSLHTDDTKPPFRHYLVSRLRRVVRQAGVDRALITVAAVDDGHMARLHRQYLGLSGPTDVLTFDLRVHPDDPLEGDIVVCVDEAIRQAASRGHDARRELLLYAVHGLLHLLGYNDQDPDPASAMHAREDELLAAIGVGPVYHAKGERP